MKKILCAVIAVMLLLTATAFSTAIDSIEIPPTPPEIENIIEDYQTIYRLTINYIYYDGQTAAPTYTEQLETGTSYNITSPGISGYTPSIYVVSGIMPARDVMYTVIYVPSGDPGDPERPMLTIEDYETPLGLGASIMNVGVCIE